MRGNLLTYLLYRFGISLVFPLYMRIRIVIVVTSVLSATIEIVLASYAMALTSIRAMTLPIKTWTTSWTSFHQIHYQWLVALADKSVIVLTHLRNTKVFNNLLSRPRTSASMCSPFDNSFCVSLCHFVQRTTSKCCTHCLAQAREPKLRM